MRARYIARQIYANENIRLVKILVKSSWKEVESALEFRIIYSSILLLCLLNTFRKE